MVALLERHGSRLALLHNLPLALKTHFLLSSHVRDSNGQFLPNAGGVCVLIARTLFAHLLATPLYLPPPTSCASFVECVHGCAILLVLLPGAADLERAPGVGLS